MSRPTSCLRLPFLLALTLALGACTNTRRPVRFSSDPAGAHVIVDGRDSGFVTPVTLSLKNESVRRVDFQLPGYERATRYLHLDTTSTLVPYDDAQVFYLTWRFPLWLNWTAFWVPYRRYSGEVPSRVFVRLERKAP